MSSELVFFVFWAASALKRSEPVDPIDREFALAMGLLCVFFALLALIFINLAYVRVYDRMKHLEAKAGPEEEEKAE